jgi:hypothetical protein
VPVVVTAATRKKYVVLAVRPVTVYDAAFEPVADVVTDEKFDVVEYCTA